MTAESRTPSNDSVDPINHVQQTADCLIKRKISRRGFVKIGATAGVTIAVAASSGVLYETHFSHQPEPKVITPDIQTINEYIDSLTQASDKEDSAADSHEQALFPRRTADSINKYNNFNKGIGSTTILRTNLVSDNLSLSQIESVANAGEISRKLSTASFVKLSAEASISRFQVDGPMEAEPTVADGHLFDTLHLDEQRIDGITHDFVFAADLVYQYWIMDSHYTFVGKLDPQSSPEDKKAKLVNMSSTEKLEHDVNAYMQEAEAYLGGLQHKVLRVDEMPLKQIGILAKYIKYIQVEMLDPNQKAENANHFRSYINSLTRDVTGPINTL